MRTMASEQESIQAEGQLSFTFKGVDCTVSVDQDDLEYLKSHGNTFLQSISHIEAPQSSVELGFQYLRFLLDHGARPSSIQSFLQSFECAYFDFTEIHTLIRNLHVGVKERQSLLKIYYDASFFASRNPKMMKDSAILREAKHGQIQLFAIFGGQGTANSSCVEELIDLYHTYTPFLGTLIDVIAPLLNSLSRLPETRDHYSGRYLDIQAWLQNPASVPDKDLVSAVTISCPIVGLLGLAHYCLACEVLGKSPGELRTLLEGATGHSQGIFVATAIAISDSWESFYQAARLIVETLFWIGIECYKNAPYSAIPQSLIEEGIINGEGRPSSMLSVVGLEREQVDKIILRLNKSLRASEQVSVGLINARDNFVVAGPPHSLATLNNYLRSIKADGDLDQSRIPFSQRKPIIQHQFLPINVPFHTQHLLGASEKVKQHLRDKSIKSISPNELMIPVYDNKDGNDLRKLTSSNLVHILIDSICSEVCNWPVALELPHASHIIAFNSGGVAELAMRLKDGEGVRIINGSDVETRNKEIGTKADLFSRQLLASSANVESWADRFRPRLSRTSTGEVRIETKLSRLLGVPPIMVAGMTPTTVHWDFVSAIMNAGYHAEMAGGGYFNAEEMSAAIRKLIASIPAGKSITCNLIYASPKQVSWQIAMLRKLAHEGVSVDGLTIGAGVPSPDVVADYINTLGLRHISFKPGSIASIWSVIEIAKAHPYFPIILQWTGGRGGGHHSFEDFHIPILHTYSAIRRCSNIIVVAGSGFGGSEDCYPYLTGTWTKRFDSYPLMPFDGILLGSCMMVAREAHTSPAAKRMISEASGVPDSNWEKTYEGVAGGVITVISEMGQPIHKLATRGVLFWAEMDKKIFRLPRKDRVAALQEKRDYVIRRLNADFARPWFGENSLGVAVDLSEMTYAEVLRRLVFLMYVSHQKRWIAPSYITIVVDFAVRILERLSAKKKIHISTSDLQIPQEFLDVFFEACPRAETELLNPDDVSYFILRCKVPGQKPVNFIPCFDDDFETFFKKDSLWQSEDVDAIIGQDVGRCCILHGPVAAQYSYDRDESSKTILDRITNGLVDKIRQDFYQGGVTPSEDGSLSSEEWSVLTPDSLAKNEALVTDEGADTLVSKMLTPERSGASWIRALFSDEFILQGVERKASPFRQLLRTASENLLHFDREGSEISLAVDNDTNAEITSMMKIRCHNEIDIFVELHQPSAHSNEIIVLPLYFRYNPTTVPFGINEKMEDRNDRIKAFYSKVWFGEDVSTVANVHSRFHSQEITLNKDLLRDLTVAVGRSYSHAETMVADSDTFPISVGIIAAWDTIAKPIVLRDVPGDLLRLVHKSNVFEYYEEAATLRVGDRIRSEAHVTAVYIEDAGKYVVVEGQIVSSGKPALKVTSTFLFKGLFDDFESTFRTTKEPDQLFNVQSKLDEAVLRDREWLVLHDHFFPLVGKTLVFRLQTHVTWKNKKTFGSITVTGQILYKRDSDQLQEIGAVNFQHAECVGNPVMDFLERKATPSTAPVDLTSPGWIGTSSLEVQIPSSNELYTRVSRDYNPIHTSLIFSQLAELPGTITQGMYTSAIASGVLEYLVMNGDRRRLRRFSATFTDVVLPGDRLLIQIKHVGAKNGRMLFKISATKRDSDDLVLDAEAEVEQPQTVFLFTGQGSQRPRMGMDLYETSAIAKAIWDDIDQHMFEKYGWSILDIVRNNPKTLTVHFGGQHGRRLRENYLAMQIESATPDGHTIRKPILPGLNREIQSYTFSDPNGLLFFSTFAQPAIVLHQKTIFEDMRSRGLVTPSSLFAGHSLGEYGSLLAFSGFMSVREAMELAFYRGLSLQFAMERDENGKTNFGMVAASPERVSKFFDEAALRRVIQIISKESGELIEIVNLNVENEQYVCAGTLQNLHTLGEILNFIFHSPPPQQKELIQELLTTTSATTVNTSSPSIPKTSTTSSPPPPTTTPITIYNQLLNQIQLSHLLPYPLILHRTKGTIPIPGIDVPFHSSHLRPLVSSYRKILQQRIPIENVHLEKLIGRWVPNVMAEPFDVGEAFVREAWRVTGSEVLRGLVGEWGGDNIWG